MKLNIVVLLLLACSAAFGQTGLTVREVKVTGNSTISTEAVMAAVKVRPGKTLNQTELLNDEESVRNLGFFKDAKILSRAVSDTEADVSIEVVEHPIIVEVQILGNKAVKTEELTEAVKAIQEFGKIWNNRNAKPIRDAITKIYEGDGFFVQIDRLGPDDVSVGTLVVSVIEPSVNEIKLIGLTRTKESTVRRVMKTKPGQPLSSRLWRRDVEELYYTYWFDTVEPAQPEPTEVPGQYNLAIEFKEARTGQLNAGVALDPQSRLVGTASYSDSNFRGLGQSVGVQLSQATAGGGPSVELAYGNRFYDAKDTSMNVQLFSKVVYNFTGSGTDPFGGSGASSQFDERRNGVSASFTRPINQYRATIGARAQNVRTLNVSPDVKDEFIQQDGNLFTMTFGWTYDVARPSVEPYAGDRASITIEPGFSDVNKIGGAVKNFTNVLGQNFYVKTNLEYRRYWSNSLPLDAPVDKPRPVVAFRVRYGAVSGTVPFYEQLFVGGADSLRGYPNQRFWGKQSLLASLEYRYPVQKAFSLIGFADYGGAWGGYGQLRDFVQSSRPDLKLGYGAGVAFRAGQLGTIRIDFAFNQEGQTRTHFTFGTSF